jgi:hypothetical protein
MVKINDMESVNPLPLLRFKLNMESKSHIIFDGPIHALVYFFVDKKFFCKFLQ